MDEDALYRTVAAALGIPVTSLTRDSALNHEPAWDSHAHVAVILALEREFGLVIDDEAVLSYTSMDDILRLASNTAEESDLAVPTEGDGNMSDTELTFTSFDGLQLTGTLETPQSHVRGRALLVHGMTANREEWGFFTQLAERLWNCGIASLRIDYRCHGKADDIRTTDLSLCGITNDIDAAYSALIDAVPGDNLPTFLVGVSFGGGLSAFWAQHNPGKVHTLFLCAPVLDYLADFDKTCGNWRESLRRDGSFDYVGRQLSRAIANEAPYFDGRVSITDPPMPVVIFHGDCDSDVPIERSRFYAGLSDLTDLIVVPGADHGFVVPGDTEVEDPDSQKNYEFVFSRLLARCEEAFDDRRS